MWISSPGNIDANPDRDNLEPIRPGNGMNVARPADKPTVAAFHTGTYGAEPAPCWERRTAQWVAVSSPAHV